MKNKIDCIFQNKYKYKSYNFGKINQQFIYTQYLFFGLFIIFSDFFQDHISFFNF